MTKRAVILGLAGSVVICGLTYFNDFVLKQTFLVGNHMPVGVYGTLIIFLLVNALLFRYARRMALTGKEIALVLGMTLVAASVPGGSLMRTFTVSLALPRHYSKYVPGWKENGLVDKYTPDGMLVEVERNVTVGKLSGAAERTATVTPVGQPLTDARIRILDGPGAGQTREVLEYDPAGGIVRTDRPWDVVPGAGDSYEIVEDRHGEVVTAFVQGAMPADDGEEGRSTVPWWAWWRPLAFWIAVILSFWGALVGLGLVVHKRWSEHERLPYPIAQLTDSLLPGKGSAFSEAFRDKRFWIAAGAVFAICLNNYIYSSYPGWIEIPTRFDFRSIMNLTRVQGMARWHYGNPQVYFTVIAVAYFLSSEVSLSVGLAPLIYGLVMGVAAAYGVSFEGGGPRSYNHQSFMLFGAFVGMTCMIIYDGRHYYLHTFKRALGMQSTEDLPVIAVWGGRTFMAGLGVFVLLLWSTGLGLGLSLAYALGLVMFYLVLGRIIAETGLFFIQARFVISTIIIGAVGPQYIGLTPSIILMMMSAVLAMDPRESLMPFLVNALKILDLREHKLGRATVAASGALVLGLAVAVPATLHWQYSKGANLSDRFATWDAAAFPYTNSLRLKYKLDAQGVTSDSEAGGPGGSISPVNSGLLWTMGITFCLLVGMAAARLRWAWWPLHPVMFLVCASWGGAVIGFSFLLGWALKVLVMKYGGARVFRSLKPVLIGLAAGEFLGALVPIVWGLLYYMVEDIPLKAFSVFPG
ncbi:MAG: DUF6785 family protein [Planctomycetota bacterium]|jgi:hypothetical protein